MHEYHTILAMHSPLRALIFDVDGTLADTERDGHRVAFNLAFAELGLHWRWSVEDYAELLAVSGGRERLLHFFEREHLALTLAERAQLALDVHRRKTAHYAQCLRDGTIAWRPGIVRLLLEAHAAGLLLAIATTTTRVNVDVLLAQAPDPRIVSCFSTIAAAEDSRLKKPDPGVYLRVLERLQLRADQCIAFEDSAAGLRAAHAAGIATVITINEYTRYHDFSAALSVVSDLGEAHSPLRHMRGLVPSGRTIDIDQLVAWHRDAPRISTNRHHNVI